MEKENVSEEVIIDLADFFKVFGDATRLKILFYLVEETEVSVSSIASINPGKEMNISRARHLNHGYPAKTYDSSPCLFKNW